jgi:hypothetical protein
VVYVEEERGGEGDSPQHEVYRQVC